MSMRIYRAGKKGGMAARVYEALGRNIVAYVDGLSINGAATKDGKPSICNFSCVHCSLCSDLTGRLTPLSPQSSSWPSCNSFLQNNSIGSSSTGHANNLCRPTLKKSCGMLRLWAGTTNPGRK